MNNEQQIIQCDDYYIRELASGYDEVVFNISIWDPLYPQLTEETGIRDRDQQWYLIKQIDGGSDTAKVVAQLDLDAWKSNMLIGYTNGSATLDQTILGVIPQGWSLVDSTGLTIQRTIEGDLTPLEVVEQCRDTYGVYFRFNNVAQTITVVTPDAAAPLGAFATRQLNLKEINYKGKSNDLVTRLYAYGKDGLSFASINGGLPYVENTSYVDKIISAVWKDERYTDPQSLLDDAKRTLAASCVPSRSYDCDVVDLRATNPEMYGFQNFEVFSVATLIDDAKGFSINYQVAERWNYPYYPEKNKVIFSSSPAKVQNQVASLKHQIESPNSQFQQQMQAAIGNATGWITGTKGGYVIINQNDQGQPYEILIMDQPTIATATKVWRWNNGGLGYSSTGYNGPYTTAITQDGAIVASFITTGTLNAALVNVINLVADNIKSGTLNAININGSIITGSTVNGANINGGAVSGTTITGSQFFSEGVNDEWIRIQNGIIAGGLVQNGQQQEWGRIDYDYTFQSDRALTLNGQHLALLADDLMVGSYNPDAGSVTGFKGQSTSMAIPLSGNYQNFEFDCITSIEKSDDGTITWTSSHITIPYITGMNTKTITFKNGVMVTQ